MTQTIETKNLIAEYSPFYAELQELESENAALVFDYESKKGNKDARSHIAKLRKLNPRIEAVRKQLKEEYLIKGRAIDSEAKEIAKRVEQMINVHLQPIEAIEQREAQRIAAIREKIDLIKHVYHESSIRELNYHIETLSKSVIDDSYQEFKEEAMAALAASLETHKKILDEAIKQEEQKKELARLQAENQRMTDEKRAQEMAAEAIKAAQIEADKKVQREAEEAKQREIKLQLELEKAKQAEREAIERAEIQKQKEAHEKADREPNVEHIRSINRLIKNTFVENGFSDDDAKKIVTLIVQNKIPSVYISY